MKTTSLATLFAAIVIVGASAVPAFAAEGTGEPFRNNTRAATMRVVRPAQFADTGSAQYPSTAGRAGSDLPNLTGDVLPSNGSEGVVQTANSLPVGFEQGTVAYAQARSIQRWVDAHNGGAMGSYAAR